MEREKKKTGQDERSWNAIGKKDEDRDRRRIQRKDGSLIENGGFKGGKGDMKI